jgi:hypothetical protein
MSTSNRELWLTGAIDNHLSELFKQLGFKLPKVKVSVGFPSGRGSKKAIGQHWTPEASDDKVGSIFISPTIDDSLEVLGVLVHELVHASVGNKAGHGPKFKRVAIELGLTGEMRSTEVGPVLMPKLKDVIRGLGKYPHAKLNLKMSPVKKQTTRMIKLECLDCGYICRASRSVILEKGPTLCPCNKQPMEFQIEDF